MGQYYNIIIREKGKRKVRAFNRTIDGEYTMAKLMEHSWYNNEMVNAICEKLYKNPSHIAWVGDYANEKEIDNLELYNYAWSDSTKYEELHRTWFNLNRLYIVNHTKKQIICCWQYVKNSIRIKQKDWYDGWVVHPLPLLTALGNQRGGGDYYGLNDDKVGIWAWDLIEIVEWEEQEELKKKGYKEFDILFSEGIEK